MTNIRKPNVAGQFYPEQTKALVEMINKFLSEAKHVDLPEQPRAIIVPHAGYIYSGTVAATIYAALSQYKDIINNVILLGPTHRMTFKGVAATMVDCFETPIGSIPVVHNWRNTLTSSVVNVNETAYEMEHSIEIQLPFLQVVLDKFELLPFVVGEEDFTAVADIIDSLWGKEDTLVVVSSDLSHYKDYNTAQELDALTSQAIVNLTPLEIKHEQACGLIPIQGLLQAAKNRKMKVRALDVRNSGDTAGSKDSVVGYGAFCFW